MKISWKTGGMKKLKCNHHEIEEVESFKCTGSKTVTNGSVKEITGRIKNTGKFY
jgi:hypothetical protein